MRIKKDKDSRKADGVIKRDNTQDKSFDGISGRRANKVKKNTKKWCKGIEGRKHDLEWKEYNIGIKYFENWREALCKNCGKKLGWSNDYTVWRKKDPNDLF